MDTNLSDDTLKLFRYKVRFVKRGYEAAFPDRDELVSDSVQEADYRASKIDEFLQELTQQKVAVRSKW